MREILTAALGVSALAGGAAPQGPQRPLATGAAPDVGDGFVALDFAGGGGVFGLEQRKNPVVWAIFPAPVPADEAVARTRAADPGFGRAPIECLDCTPAADFARPARAPGGAPE